MLKINKYLYKKASTLDKSSFLSIAFVMFYIFGLFLGMWLLSYLLEQPVLFFVLYSLFLLVAYYFANFSIFLHYINTNDIRKKILLDNEAGNVIAVWNYTKDEWSAFSQKRNKAILKNRIKGFVILISICIVLFLLLDSTLALLFSTIIISIVISVMALSDVYVKNWKKILKREEISVIFSVDGLVISELYTYPSKLKFKRLSSIENNKQNNTILLKYSVYSLGNTDFDASVYSEIIEFPIPERYQIDVKKIIRKTNTYSKFEI